MNVINKIGKWLKTERTSCRYKNYAFVIAICVSVCCICLYYAWTTMPYREYTINFAVLPDDSSKVSTNLNVNLGLGDISDEMFDGLNKKQDSLGFDFTIFKSSKPFLKFHNGDIKDFEKISLFKQLKDSIKIHKYVQTSGFSFYTEFGVVNKNITNLGMLVNKFAKLKNSSSHNQFIYKKENGYSSCVLTKTAFSVDDLQNDSILKVAGVSSMRGILVNHIKITGTNLIVPQCWSPEDISQSYIKILINPKKHNAHNYFADNSSLRINFGTIAELSPIDPVPDKITATSIIYEDRNKIQKIVNDGSLSFYMKNPVLANIQTARIFLLTTILTFALNAIAGFLIVFLLKIKYKTSITYKKTKNNMGIL